MNLEKNYRHWETMEAFMKKAYFACPFLENVVFDLRWNYQRKQKNQKNLKITVGNPPRRRRIL